MRQWLEVQAFGLNRCIAYPFSTTELAVKEMQAVWEHNHSYVRALGFTEM